MDTNDKSIIKKLLFDRAVLLSAYVFLLLPVVLFLVFWTKLYIGLPAAALALLGFYFIIRSKREYKDVFKKDYRKRLAAVVITAFIWTLLSGQGGLFFQNADYNMRNAIYSDLVKQDWPVIFHIPDDIAEGLTEDSNAYQNALYYGGKDVTIVYYMGYWLPPAAASKIVNGVTGGGMAAAEIILFLWTFAGIFCILYLFLRAFKKFSYKIILVFIFFSGMDAVMSSFFYVTGLEGMLFTEGRLVPHLEAWTMQQYTSNTSALFWVFNQAVPLWLFCCIMLNEKDLKHIFFPYACLALNSTLPMIGALPLIFYFIIYRLKEKNAASAEKTDFKNLGAEVLRYCNITNITAIPVLALSFLYTASSPAYAAFSFMSGAAGIVPLLIILGSLIFETALIIFLLFNSGLKKKKGLLITVSVLLFIIPFFNVGARYDFTMRASLPSLFFLCYLCCYTLLSSNLRQVKRLLAIVLIIGGLTAAMEIIQPIAYAFTGNNPRAEAIASLGDITNTKFEPKNCLGTLDSFFMKYILKKP